MRCSECDQILMKPCTGRLKDGRIVFGWCTSCLQVADGIETELTANVRLFDGRNNVALPFGGTGWESAAARSKQRLFALSMLACVLGFWGLTMLVAGFARSGDPTPINPLGNGSSSFLIAGGGGLMGTAAGLLIGVWRVRRKTTRKSAKSVGPDKNIFAHGSAVFGILIIGLAASQVEPKASALGVLISAPCFLMSWLILGNSKPVEYSEIL